MLLNRTPTHYTYDFHVILFVISIKLGSLVAVFANFLPMFRVEMAQLDTADSMPPTPCRRLDAANSVPPTRCSQLRAADSVPPTRCRRLRAADSVPPTQCRRLDTDTTSKQQFESLTIYTGIESAASSRQHRSVLGPLEHILRQCFVA